MEQQNNWEVWHDTNWTEFELHSAVFGHLRKHLYPQGYLVRGNYSFITKEGKNLRPDIAVFKKTSGTPAMLELLIEIKPITSQSAKTNKNFNKKQEDNYRQLGVPLLYVTSRIDFKQILEKVTEYLQRGVNDLPTPSYSP